MEFDNDDAIERFLEIKAIEDGVKRNQKRLQTGYKVFLSYSTVDHKIAKQISRILSELEISHFFDKKDISWGQDVLKGVSEGLKSCSHLLVILSPASLKSGWVAFEIGQASALGKVILPYLTHPSLDIPDFIKQYHYKTSLAEIRKFFEKPALDQGELEELFRILISRLPIDLNNYAYCTEESQEGKDVWRSLVPVQGPDVGGNGYGRIIVESTTSAPKVEIQSYRLRSEFTGEAGWHDSYIISYNHERGCIESQDTCHVLEYGGGFSSDTCRWTASEAFWAEIAKMLREHLDKQTKKNDSNV